MQDELVRQHRRSPLAPQARLPELARTDYLSRSAELWKRRRSHRASMLWAREFVRTPKVHYGEPATGSSEYPAALVCHLNNDLSLEHVPALLQLGNT